MLNLYLMTPLLLLSTITGCLKVNCSSAAAVSMALKSVDFEVFGRVQGVFFRKYTKEQAEKLSLKGWCRNTSRGTVEGQMEGPSDKVESIDKEQNEQINKANLITPFNCPERRNHGATRCIMQFWEDDKNCRDSQCDTMHWLKTTGSPSSKIDKADFKNNKDITDYSFNNFDIRRDS